MSGGRCLHLVQQLCDRGGGYGPVRQRRRHPTVELLGREGLEPAVPLADQEDRDPPFIGGEAMTAAGASASTSDRGSLIGGSAVDHPGVLDSTHRAEHGRRVPAN